MTEELLSFIWRNRMFAKNLKTSSGEPLIVHHPGFENHNSGPDYSMAQIRFDTTVLVGLVELHVKSSDYLQHGHQTDPAYDKILVHVVWDHDLETDPSKAIHLLELKHFVSEGLVDKARKLFRSKGDLSCSSFLPEIPDIYKYQVLETGQIARLEEKSRSILNRRSDQGLSRHFLTMLMGASGSPVNKEPMTWLAESVSIRNISRLIGDHRGMEALLFGQAGMLDQALDPYQEGLKERYDFMKKKWGLKPLRSYIFKFGRMRPINFPSVLIAVWASILSKHGHRLMDLVSTENKETALELYGEEASEYWTYHYNFAKKGKVYPKRFGPSILNRILINALIPFLFGYGRLSGKETLELRALNWMQELPPESNKVTRLYENLGWKIDSASDSQALIHWFHHRCQAKKCLNCSIANHWLKQDEQIA